jgi:hypothetical protein
MSNSQKIGKEMQKNDEKKKTKYKDRSTNIWKKESSRVWREWGGGGLTRSQYYKANFVLNHVSEVRG